MSILDKIEQQWLSYVGEIGRLPKYLYLGRKEALELDEVKGTVALSHKHMFVVMVQKGSWLSVGDKYTEEA